MAFRGGSSTQVADRRRDGSTTALTADASFNKGYCYEHTVDDGGISRGQFTSELYLNSNGMFVCMWGEFELDSATWDADSAVMAAQDVGTNKPFQVRLDTSGRLILRVTVGGSTSSSAALFTPAGNTKYILEVKFTRVTSTQATAELFVDGVSKGTLTHNHAGDGGSIGMLTYYWRWDSDPKNTGKFRAGELALCDSTGAEPNNLLRSVGTSGIRCETLKPNGNGTETDWTGDSTAVDDAFGSYSEADYINSGSVAADKIESYTLDDTSGSIASGDTICGVVPHFVPTDASPSPSVCRVIVNDGADSADTAMFNIVSSGCFFVLFSTGPSGAFTKTSVDGLKVKIKRPSTSTNDVQIAAEWVEVWSFTPNPATGDRRRQHAQVIG